MRVFYRCGLAAIGQRIDSVGWSLYYSPTCRCLLQRFDNLYFLFQQTVHHFVEGYALLRRALGQIGMYVDVQIDRQAKFRAGPKKLTAFAFAEIVFRLYLLRVANALV